MYAYPARSKIGISAFASYLCLLFVPLSSSSVTINTRVSSIYDSHLVQVHRGIPGPKYSSLELDYLLNSKFPDLLIIYQIPTANTDPDIVPVAAPAPVLVPPYLPHQPQKPTQPSSPLPASPSPTSTQLTNLNANAKKKKRCPSSSAPPPPPTPPPSPLSVSSQVPQALPPRLCTRTASCLGWFMRCRM